MGKKSYDSYSDMTGSGGSRAAQPKSNPYVNVTDTKLCGEKSFKGVGNVKESRLNSGSDRYFMGSRRKPAMKAGSKLTKY